MFFVLKVYSLFLSYAQQLSTIKHEQKHCSKKTRRINSHWLPTYTTLNNQRHPLNTSVQSSRRKKTEPLTLQTNLLPVGLDVVVRLLATLPDGPRPTRPLCRPAQCVRGPAIHLDHIATTHKALLQHLVDDITIGITYRHTGDNTPTGRFTSIFRTYRSVREVVTCSHQNTVLWHPAVT